VTTLSIVRTNLAVVATPAGYSGKPAAVKLGLKPGQRVLLADPPDGFELAPMPPDVQVDRRPGAPGYDLVLVFCLDRATLAARFGELSRLLTPAGALWVAWPKRASKVPTDLDENVVRDVGLADGLVDVKVIAVDSVWSGLKFVSRLADRPSGSRRS
jgi:hypothetical protein